MGKKVKIFIDDITRHWGTERAVVNLANTLADHNYDIEIVSSYSTLGTAVFPLHSNVNIKHLGVFQLGSGRSVTESLKGLYKLRKAFIEALDEQSAVLIGTNTVINSLLATIKFTEKNRVSQVIGCEHLPYDAATKFLHKLRHGFYRYLDHVVLLTAKDASKYNDAGFKNLSVIPNEAPDPKPIPSVPRENVLISVGRLMEQKGFDILIDDISPLLREFTDWRLEIYGEGELRPLLSQMIVERNMQNRIMLCGAIKDLDVRYHSSAIMLMSSRYEGLPMVLLEAQACSLPIVAYDCETGPSEIIDQGESGYLIPMGNSDEFRKRVAELMLDRDKRVRMGTAAADSVRKFGSDSVFLKWQLLLEGESGEICNK